ncbi:helix-turn-helix domain-containing protein [Mycolicibacterium fortuitum]|nr:helix-turn-helix domain-containing protein [Mycolicibacterium fortuitum]
MRELIRIVQAHMDEYGVSEAEVARRIGATPQTVNQWRNGELKQLPRQKYLQALAELTRTDYVTVLSAALVDANYITEPLARSYVVGSIDFGPLVAGLAVDADDLHTVAQNLDTLMDTNVDAEDTDEVESLISNTETLISDVNDLVSEVDDFVEAVQEVAKKVVGDPERLRRMKRETKRFRRQQARSSSMDLLAQVEHERTDPYYRPGKATAGPAGAEAAMDARARKSRLKPTTSPSAESDPQSNRDRPATDTAGNNPETGSNITGSGGRVPQGFLADQVDTPAIDESSVDEPHGADQH